MMMLSQFGSWKSDLQERAREVMAHRFAESAEAFDYTVCERPNGTYYGIATGKKCRKGRQVNRAAVLGTLAKRGIPREVLGKIAKVKDDKEFGKAVQALNSGRKKISADAIKPTKPTAAPKVAPTKPTGEKMTASQRKARLEEQRAEREARRGQLQAKRNIRERKKAEEAPKPKEVAKPKGNITPKTREEGLDELRRLGFLKNEKLVPRLNQLDDDKFGRLVKLVRARAAERADLEGLSAKQKEAVRRVSGAKRTVKEGGDTTESRQTTKALVELYKNSKTGKAEAGQTEYPPEVAKRYLDFLKTGQLAVAKKNISDEELDRVWESLPAKTRASLVSKGQPPSYITRDEARGKMILKELIATGFRDEITGQPYNWVDIQPDHKVSIAMFKGPKKDLEKNNLVMTHKGYNNAKGRIEGQAVKKKLGEEYINSELAKMFTMQANRTQQQFEDLLASKLSSASVQKDATRSIISNSKLWSTQDWVSNVQSQPAPILKALVSSMGSRATPNRFQPSKSQGRNPTPGYSGSDFLAPALLLAKGVPREQWPAGMWDKSVKALRSEIKRAQAKEAKENSEAGTGYDRIFFDRFSKFVTGNGGMVPIEYVDIASEMFV